MVHMAQDILEERLRWVLSIARKEVRLVDAVKVFPYGKRTLERWVAEYKKGGVEALEPVSTRPKTSPQETPIRLKEQFIELRKEKLCALKLHTRRSHPAETAFFIYAQLCGNCIDALACGATLVMDASCADSGAPGPAVAASRACAPLGTA